MLSFGCLSTTQSDGNGVSVKLSWQEPNAKVSPKGNIEWAPRQFRFGSGASVRYIDFEDGNDSNDGLSNSTPWKHHPWDPNAKGNAKKCSGIHTYVFKGGVWYRGEIEVKESGKLGNPIRLTRNPSWGEGEAVICGSEIVRNWKKGSNNKCIPEPEKVWHADLMYAPRSVWMVGNDNAIVRIPLARMPNWKVSDPDDVLKEWWTWDNLPPLNEQCNKIKVGGRNINLVGDTAHIKGKQEKMFEGALIRNEMGWVGGRAYANKVLYMDTAAGNLGFSSQGTTKRGMRYYLEDKPQYLDDPDGEFWFDKRGDVGRLYIRLPNDIDPNTVRVEVAKRRSLIHGGKVESLDISGLTFRFTGPEWDYTKLPLDFSYDPYRYRSSANLGCVHVFGNGKDIRIANCLFEHVYLPIHIRANAKGSLVDGVVIEDNKICYADQVGIQVDSGNLYGHPHPIGVLGDVRIMRNSLFEIGQRPARYCTGAITVSFPITAEIAGNVIERSYVQGINVMGGKSGWGARGELPFSRVLIHHNKVWDSLLATCDFGGIETWQGGPFYVYDNLSYNALGVRTWNHSFFRTGDSACSGFGHAYYLDGAFKNYHFNNIAWGKSNDPESPLCNDSAFQEIHSYQNTFFNNTAFKFAEGSRRQAPQAGRNKYLGNVWSNISHVVFRHGEPAKIQKNGGGNAADVGKGSSLYAIETNAYSDNVFYDFKKMGCVAPYFGKGWNTPESALLNFDEFKAALIKEKSISSELGSISNTQPLRDPANGDFRPAEGSAVIGQGVKAFVPWALSGVVGEWNFYHAGNDPSRILDEHWFMTDYFNNRQTYHNTPMYPLKAVNVEAGDYVQGQLEDWVAGALKFDPEKKQYATLSNADMMKPFHFKARKTNKDCVAKGKDLKNPQIYNSNMLIEVYFKTALGHTGGILIEKMKNDVGYSLTVTGEGKAKFAIAGNKDKRFVTSNTPLNDGTWHHVVAEADRQAKTIAIYVDGKLDSKGDGLDGTVSLANDGDLFVGGSPEGRYLNGSLDFMRITQGTLQDAKTSIEELYAWEFDGPFLRDFTGRKPEPGQRRDAGVLQH